MADNSDTFGTEPLATELAALRVEFEELSGLSWSPYPQELSLPDQLSGALRRLLRLHADLRSQVRSLLEDKGLVERQLLKKEDLSSRLAEQARDLEARLKAQTESFQKEFRAGEIRRQALENDLKRLRNEQKEKSFTVVKNTLKSGLFINAPAPRTDPPPSEGLLQLENRALLSQLQDVRTFKREVHVAATRMSAKIDASYEVRRRYLLEGLRVEGFQFGYFELLKHTHVPDQGWFSGENAKALLEKMEKHLQFQDLFDRFLSQRFEQFVGAEAEKVPRELGGHKWDKLISNDFRKIGDTVFLQCALQNFRDVTSDHMHLFQLEKGVESQRAAVGGTNRETPKRMSSEFVRFQEKVDRLMEEINAAVAISQGHFEASGRNPPSSSSNNQ